MSFSFLHAARWTALWLALTVGAHAARAPQIGSEQARKVAILVARHESIPVDDPNTLLDSMDSNGAFVPGYYSFIFIHQDPHRPGSDKTLGMIAVSPRTGDAWEINLCKHFDFPELLRLQRSIMHSTGVRITDEQEQRKALRCEHPGADGSGL